jgi:integrase/recombinase XerD
MNQKYFISLYLDTRRTKKNGKYPMKLRVFTPRPRIQKLYGTKYSFTENEFRSIWLTTKPRTEYKSIRLELQAIESRANKVADRLPYFTFDSFERAFIGKTKYDKNSVVLYYDKAIANYKRHKQAGTASNYDLSLKSLLNYHGRDSLSFNDITPDWLKSYERWMTDDMKRSQTTVGFYLRPLRAVFNSAILDKNIDEHIYPFGKKKYQIPAPKSVKKALSREQLKILYEAVPAKPEQQKAKDFWFLIYSLDGMNVKDISLLKYKDFNGEIISYRRAKTINTKRTHLPSTVFVNDHSKNVISKYGNKNKEHDNFIFNIIESGNDAGEQERRIKKFTRFINQHFLLFAKSCGIDLPISTYWARHSFATALIRNGASMEHVSERMHGGNMVTTKSYFAGFEDETKKKMTDQLLEF